MKFSAKKAYKESVNRDCTAVVNGINGAIEKTHINQKG